MNQRLLNIALLLSLITIFYNIAEGLLSIYFGIADGTIALLGFGADSFVEVISGTGIAHMVYRTKREKSTPEARDAFERTALRITGTAFYILTAGLVAGSVLRLISDKQPETTMVGVIISIVSILTMYILLHYKLKIGHKLNSDAIIADAQCTRACFYLSFILLGSSLLYELFEIGYFDIAGSLGIAWFAYSEGREAWQKVRSETLSCHC